MTSASSRPSIIRRSRSDIDRELAGLIGVTPEHLKHALVMVNFLDTLHESELLD